MASAYDHPEVISDYLHSESQAGRLIGPMDPTTVGLHTSPFGVIPKKSNPGKWRLILDLSSPDALSVNDGIDPDLCSVHCSGLDEAIAMISRLGKGAQLAKIDLKNAYRIIPVHPDDRPLLGMSGGSEVFLDAALPFGLRSSPKIFLAVADVLLWVMAQRGVVEGIHYLDDFLFAGRANSDSCARALSCALNTCQILGVPVASEKIEGPASCVPGNSHQHRKRGTAYPRSQTHPPASRAGEMAEQKGLQQARAPISHRSPPPRSVSSEAWETFHSQPH